MRAAPECAEWWWHALWSVRWRQGAPGRDLRPFQSVYSRTTVSRFLDHLALQRVCGAHISSRRARTRLRNGSKHAPLMLLRFACALDAGKFGDSSAGSGAGRGGAPEAGIAKDKKGTDVFNPFPWLVVGLR